MREACGALRCLTMDDDVRVQFGKAHEHTKLVVMEHSGLERLFQLARSRFILNFLYNAFNYDMYIYEKSA